MSRLTTVHYSFLRFGHTRRFGSVWLILALSVSLLGMQLGALRIGLSSPSASYCNLAGQNSATSFERLVRQSLMQAGWELPPDQALSGCPCDCCAPALADVVISSASAVPEMASNTSPLLAQPDFVWHTSTRHWLPPSTAPPVVL
jgi:hypothetical protein